MTLKEAIRLALQDSTYPLNADRILAIVRQRTRREPTRKTVLIALGHLIKEGEVVNVCRDPETKKHRESVCTYPRATP